MNIPRWLKNLKGNRDAAYACLIFAAFLVIALMAERYSKQADQLRIYRNPAQLQVFDPGNTDANRSALPAVSSINCEILPCPAVFTGGYRQCVVACTLVR
jgi:ABC-type microcin C transport system permease subunit YejE